MVTIKPSTLILVASAVVVVFLSIHRSEEYNEKLSCWNHPGEKKIPTMPVALPTVPKRICLLGERNSGTNYVEKVLRQAFSPRYFCSSNRNSKYPYASGAVTTLRFKHMWRHFLFNESEIEQISNMDTILWIMVVRSPCDWADGMLRKPWHACPPAKPARCPGPYIGKNIDAFNNMSRSTFFQTPWRDWVESQISPRDFTYSNVFALRLHKLKLMQQLMMVREHNFKIVHLDPFENAPHKFVTQLSLQFGLNVSPTYTPVWQSEKIHIRPLCLSEEEMHLAEHSIEWDVELEFGFDLTSCHGCVTRAPY